MVSVTVVIATKNRKDDLRDALKSALSQQIRAEIIVYDDGSVDGTAEMVRKEFPDVRVLCDPRSRGYIVRRNELANLASGELLFSIDDDAVFSSPNVIEQTLRDFDHHRIGAVAIPFINVRQDGVLRQRATSSNKIDVLASFVGTAYAVRRDVFLRLGGYRDHLVHQGEEGDFCIRMLNAGYVVRAGTADPIHHFESPRRSFQRMDFYGRRNDVLFAWHNCPLQYLPGRLAAATAGGAAFAFRVGRPYRMGMGLLAGYFACVQHLQHRSPVSSQAYRMYRMLIRNGPVDMSTIGPQLDEIAAARECEK